MCGERSTRFFFFKDILNVALLFRKMIFFWIKPCLFLAKSNNPNLFTYSWLLVLIFFFSLLDYQPTLHSWFKESYALNYKKSYFSKWTPKYSCYKAHGNMIANGWLVEADDPNCKMCCGQFLQMGIRHLNMSTSYSRPRCWHELTLLSPKCLRPVLVGSYGLKLAFAGSVQMGQSLSRRSRSLLFPQWPNWIRESCELRSNWGAVEEIWLWLWLPSASRKTWPCL